MNISIVNQSTLVSDSDFHIMVAALKQVMANEFASAWGSERGPANISIAPDRPSVPAGNWVCTILDDPAQQSYFGFHVNNLPISEAFVFANVIVNYGQPILYDPTNFITVASTLCHEIMEMVVDPCCNQWWDCPASLLAPFGIVSPASVVAEVCDPVEFDVYTTQVSGDVGLLAPLPAPVPVTVPNFVYPAWKDQWAPPGTQFDQMGMLPFPFSADYGGAMLIRTGAPGSEQMFYGSKVPTGAVARPDRLDWIKNFHNIAGTRMSNRLGHVPRSRLLRYT